MIKKTKLVIIPARGGSKRIKNKNIKDFDGKPLLSYPIETCLSENFFDEVMVSTDNQKIAEVAEKFGAKVPFMRSPETSDDFTSTSAVIEEVISNYSSMGKLFDYVICLYPAAVNISMNHLRCAIEKLENSEATSLVSVVKPNFPYQQSLTLNGGKVEYLFPEFKTERTQDLKPSFHDAGQFYMAKQEHFEHGYRFISENTIAYELSESEVQDIDTEEDFSLALLKFQAKRGKEKKL